MKRFLIVTALLAGATVAVAQSSFWKDQQGTPVGETSARKSNSDFAGWLLVTPDEDWREKWNTPSATTPNFNEAKTVSPGKKLFVLTFFVNPKLVGDRQANVACDFKVIRPDGTFSLDQKGATCFRGRIPGNPYNLYLSAPVIAFVGDEGDPAGVWTVEVNLKDVERRVELLLHTTFTLK